MGRNRGHIVTVSVVLAVACIWLVAWLSASGALWGVNSFYNVRLATLSADGLAAGSNVAIAGIPVGHVASVTERGDGAVIGVAVDQKFAPLPVDTRYEIRLRTVVGENYLALYPGHSKHALPSGGILGPGQAVEPVDPDQIFNVLRSAQTRAGARATIRGLGHGLAGEGQALNRTLAGASGLVLSAEPVLQVLGAQDRQQVARVTGELGDLASAIGLRSAAVSTLARSAQTVLRSVAARDASFSRLLAALPGTLAQVRSTTGVLQSVSGSATPVLTNLATAIRELSPSVAALRPAAQEGTFVVSELGRVAPGLRVTLSRLRGLSAPAAGALPQLHSLLCQANPLVKYLSPYAPELGALAGNDMGSLTNWYDGIGHGARLYLSLGETTLRFLSPPLAAVAHQLIATGVIGLNHQIGYHPLIASGQAGETVAPGAPVGPAGVTTRYPHVLAEC